MCWTIMPTVIPRGCGCARSEPVIDLLLRYAHALKGQDDHAGRRWDEFQRKGTTENLERKVQ